MHACLYGAWAASSPAFRFSMATHFYHTMWIKFLIALLALSLLWTVHLGRAGCLSRKANARFFERLSERERIARDLHDTFFRSIGGILLCFHTGISALRPGEPMRQVFEEILKQSDEVMLEGQEPFLDSLEQAWENRDLEQAFAIVCEELSQMFAIQYQIIRRGHAKPIVPVVRQELFFIGREALMNASQHSQANTIGVDLSFHRRSVGLRIRDDGNEVDPAVQGVRHSSGSLWTDRNAGAG